MSTALTFILGCTGCGKGHVGRALARLIDAEIISIDSMKVFRRMDIGTAKPSPSLRTEIPHHLIDIVEPYEEFSVAQFVGGAEAAIADIAKRGRPILAVGGTSLYIKALSEGLFEGPSADPVIRARLQQEADTHGPEVLRKQLERIDPQACERFHPNDLRRTIRALEVYEQTGRTITELQDQWGKDHPRYDCRFIGLRRPLEEQSARTNRRVMKMIELGLVDEVRSLLAESPPMSTTARQALGYAEIIEHLEGDVSLDDAIERIKINTRRFSKAQRTWHRRFTETHWMDLSPQTDLEDTAQQIANMEGMHWCKTQR